MSDLTADNTQSTEDVQVIKNTLATITHLAEDKRVVLSGFWTLTTLGDVWAEVQNVKDALTSFFKIDCAADLAAASTRSVSDR